MNHSLWHRSDVELVRDCQLLEDPRFPQEELLRRYAKLVRVFAMRTKLTIPGGDRDDLEQEAMLGFLNAIRTYDPTVGIPFVPFALFAVRRWLYTAVKIGNAEKRRVLTHSLREARDWGGDLVTVVEYVIDQSADVEDLVIAREELEILQELLRSMSDLERTAVVGGANGLSYAAREGLPEGTRVKKIDNALQRAKRKIAAALA